MLRIYEERAEVPSSEGFSSVVRRARPWLQSGIDKGCLTGTTDAADPEVTSLQILLL